MKQLFIPYKLAVIATKQGFDEECFGYWYNGKKELIIENTNNRNYSLEPDIAAPLYQQIVDWFREKHNLTIWANPYDNFDKPFNIVYCYHIIEINWGMDKECHLVSRNNKFKTYYEALNKAIQEAFKLI